MVNPSQPPTAPPPQEPTTVSYPGGLSVRLVDLGLGDYVHDMASRRYPLYTRGNVGEVFPEVVYPFTSSLARHAGSEPFTELYIAAGGMTEDDFDEDLTIGAPVSTFAGYNYLNLSVARTLTGRAPGSKPEDIDTVFFGREGLAPPHRKQKTDRNLRASLALVRFAITTTRITELPQLDQDKIEFAEWRDGLTPVADATDDELADRIVDAVERVTVLFARHLLVSQKAATAHVVLGDLCERFGGDGDLDAVSLMAGIGDVESAEPARYMWALSRLDPTSAAYEGEFQAFLADYGSRGPNEWDAASPSWGTDPSMVTTMVNSLRAADVSQSPTARDRRLADERVATLRQLPTNRLVRPMIDRVIQAATVLSQGRERAKTTVVKVVHEIRLAGNELGRRLAERAGSDRADDLWYVYWHEFADYRSEPATFADRIAQRRATRDALMQLEPPFIFDGDLPPLDTWERRDAETTAPAATGTVLQGTPGCAGTVTGTARVVRDASDDAELGPGTILIAPLTDPSWTPLFMGVDAVVVNVGGQMSHAVIVARDLGIPCVVSVERATDVIPDGATITVDGLAGTVTIE